MAALIRSSQDLKLGALAVILLSSAVAGPVIELGERGYDRVYSMSNSEGQKWLEAHKKRASFAEPVFYVSAAIALAAILALIKKPSWAPSLTWTALVAGVLCLGLAGWIAKAGGRIRHPEFRSGPP